MKKTPLKRTGFKRKLPTSIPAPKVRSNVPNLPIKKKVQTVTQIKKKIWEECKRIIRTRYISEDGNYRCFTCGQVCTAPHTGHVITSSLCSTTIRYSLDNLRLQCYACNIHKSGNWVEFKKRLGDEYINNLIKRNDETKNDKFGLYELTQLLEEYKVIHN